MEWRVELGADFAEKARKACLEQLRDHLQQRMAQHLGQISGKIASMLAATLEGSQVLRCIRGGGSVDLRAELGLSDGMAAMFADGMCEFVGEQTEINVTSDLGGGIRIQVSAVPADWKAYKTSVPYAVYLSVNKKGLSTEIPVSDWLLVDPNIDVGQLAYSIVYATQIGKTAIQGSRTGRAVMVKGALPNGPYVLPAICSKDMGENFVEYTLGTKQVAGAILEEVAAAL